MNSANGSTALNIALSAFGVAFAQTDNNRNIRSASSTSTVYFGRDVSDTEVVVWCVIGF